jgi:hypothetical protein
LDIYGLNEGLGGRWTGSGQEIQSAAAAGVSAPCGKGAPPQGCWRRFLETDRCGLFRISADSGKVNCHAIRDRDGADRVSLRRVRTELGRGSLQTIHKHLAEWRAKESLKPQTEPAPVAVQEDDLPVKFVPPYEVDEMTAAQTLTPHISKFGDVDIRKGVPEGLVHIVHKDAQRICEGCGIPFAPALVRFQKGSGAQENEFRIRDAGYFSKVYTGIVVPANFADLILQMCDRIMAGMRMQEAFHTLRSEHATVTLDFRRELFDALSQQAEARGVSLTRYISKILSAVGNETVVLDITWGSVKIIKPAPSPEI